MEKGPPGTDDSDEEFDYQLTHFLQTHERELDEQSEALLATGSLSVAIPGGTLRARLRLPRCWRRGLLEMAAEDSPGGVVRTSSTPLDRGTRDQASLRREITLRLAFEHVYGQHSTEE